MNTSPEKYISACDRLYTFSSNKRLAILDNEFIQNDDIGSLAAELNGDIYSKHGLNVFELADKSDIMLYEEILTEKITQFSFEYFLSPDEIIEEEKFLGDAHEVSKDYLGKFELLSSPILQKRFHITYNDLKYIVHNAHKSIIIESKEDKEKTELFFITSVFKILHKKKIVLIGAIPRGKFIQSSEKYVNKTKSGIHMPFSEKETAGQSAAFEYDNKFLYVSLMLVFDYEANFVLLDSPLKLFFKALDLYGVPLAINNNTKTFYYEATINGNLYPGNIRNQFIKNPFSVIKIIDNPSDVEGPYTTYRWNGNLLKLHNLYCLNIKSYLDDLRSFRI